LAAGAAGTVLLLLGGLARALRPASKAMPGAATTEATA
jgi:hypothetical protein